jgi:hypothetical protein
MSGHPDLTSARWRTSTYTAANEACVEVAPVPHTIAVRDSKNRTGAVLSFGEHAWSTFVGTIKAGDLDLS